MLLCFQFLDTEFSESFTEQSSLFLARSRDSLHKLFRLNDKMGFLIASVGKKFNCNAEEAGDMGSNVRSGRSPGGGNGNPLQYSCLENPMDRGAWQATVHRVAKSWT